MTDHFIKLRCENCGADLDVYDDMEQFACGYCGTEIAVQRRGGTVVLKLMTPATKNMAAGADQTSAELALMRLKEEAGNLSKRYDAMLQERVERNKRGYVIGISLLLVGFVVVRSGYGLMVGLCLLIAGIFTISYIRRHDKKVAVDLRELHAKLDVLNGRIEDHAFRP
jgi:ribosomal protein S27E